MSQRDVYLVKKVVDYLVRTAIALRMYTAGHTSSTDDHLSCIYLVKKVLQHF